MHREEKHADAPDGATTSTLSFRGEKCGVNRTGGVRMLSTGGHACVGTCDVRSVVLAAAGLSVFC